MKIVYLYPQFAKIAGTERVLIDKMNCLANGYGYYVMMITTEQGNHPLAFPLSKKVLHIDLNVRYCDLYKKNRLFRFLIRRKYNFLFQKRFDKLINEYHPDIVITTTYNSRFLSVINNCPFQFRRVLESHIDKKHLHHKDPSNRTNLWKYMNAYVGMKTTEHEARKFDVLVALNREDANDWGQFLSTIVIPNVVNLNPTNSYSDQNSKQVIFVGRYNVQKGLRELFVIWGLVHSKHPDWHLHLYGTGELLDYVLSESVDSQKNIHHHEPNSNIHEKYIESSLLVIPSVYEPFGLVVVEAMSCGLPVVAFSDLVGPKNIIKNQFNGFLIPNRDIGLFAEKVCILIESRELRLEMGHNATISSQRYSSNVVMPKWNSLFQNICNNNN